LQVAEGSAAAGWCSLANIGKGEGRQGTRRMDARAFEKCKRPSRRVIEAPSRAVHTSFRFAVRPWLAMGADHNEGHSVHNVWEELRALRCAEGPGASASANRLEGLVLTRKIVGQTRKNVNCKWDQKVVGLVCNPISAMGGVEGLQGSLAPAGAIVKVAGMTPLQFCGPARRRKAWKAPTHPLANPLGHPLAIPNQSGALRTYPDEVGPAPTGSVTCASSRAEVVGHANS
jgi:hypothetical protein